LDSEINTYSSRLETLRKKHIEKRNMLAYLSSKKQLFDEFNTIRYQVRTMVDTVSQLEIDTQNKASREYLNRLYAILNTLLTDIRSELVDITTISKEQEMLIVRLDTEVNTIIGDLKPKFDNSKIVEKSLYELPIKYTQSFVNNIIETTNYFINEIMTYPLQLIPVDDNDMCDFTFPVLIENEVKVKDISVCSDGQKAIIQLAFNLALIVELKFNQYPIYIDECDRALDTTHKIRLTEFLLKLISSGIVSQMFVVNHDETMINQLADTGNIVVLNGDNLVLPERYNEKTKIVYM